MLIILVEERKLPSNPSHVTYYSLSFYGLGTVYTERRKENVKKKSSMKSCGRERVGCKTTPAICWSGSEFYRHLHLLSSSDCVCLFYVSSLLPTYYISHLAVSFDTELGCLHRTAIWTGSRNQLGARGMLARLRLNGLTSSDKYNGRKITASFVDSYK
jgi:hypothetical protein